jgi:carboxymethylenebutenolidase
MRNAGELIRYVAVPRSGRGRGVLVIHAWWGLNRFFRSFCDRLAAAGFVALAPDLFGGRIADTVADARKLRASPKREPTYRTLIQALEELRAHDAVTGTGLGVVGFSMGGHWALWLSAHSKLPITATVTFYGARGGDYAGSRAAYQGHFAEQDDWVSAAARARLRKCLEAANCPSELHVYPGARHWFFEEDRPDAYDKHAAALAWQRTRAFLDETL